MGSPDVPKAPPPPPPAPDPFDTQVRATRAASRNQQLRARGRRSTLLTSASGAPGTVPTVGGKNLLGQ